MSSVAADLEFGVGQRVGVDAGLELGQHDSRPGRGRRRRPWRDRPPPPWRAALGAPSLTHSGREVAAGIEALDALVARGRAWSGRRAAFRPPAGRGWRCDGGAVDSDRAARVAGIATRGRRRSARCGSCCSGAAAARRRPVRCGWSACVAGGRLLAARGRLAAPARRACGAAAAGSPISAIVGGGTLAGSGIGNGGFDRRSVGLGMGRRDAAARTTASAVPASRRSKRIPRIENPPTGRDEIVATFVLVDETARRVQCGRRTAPQSNAAVGSADTI